MAVDLQTLRASARNRADLNSAAVSGSKFISDAEANEMVNAAVSELHDLLVTTYRDHFQSSTTINLVSGTESYSLPSDFYKGLAVFYLQSGKRYRLEQFMLDEIADYDGVLVSPSTDGKSLLYRYVGNNIYFTPKPGSGSVELWYVPTATKLVNDTDEISVAFVSGWEEYIVIDAAIQMREKSEMSTQGLWARKNALRQRIQTSARVRDAGSPQRIRDVYESRYINRRRRRYY